MKTSHLIESKDCSDQLLLFDNAFLNGNCELSSLNTFITKIYDNNNLSPWIKYTWSGYSFFLEDINIDSMKTIFKGISRHSLEVINKGKLRGNFAQIHPKAWLEVSDKYHRYGKNLRVYYKHWLSLGHPTNMFFDWLDSKNQSVGMELPNLKECPRNLLDSDTVLYITRPEHQARYRLKVIPESFDNHAKMIDCNGKAVCTGPDGWIFVLRNHKLYGTKKISTISGKFKKRFHHSSFFGGKAVAAAGIFIGDVMGRLILLLPQSGHYRPGESHMQNILFYLKKLGVNLNSFKVDMQKIMYVSREKSNSISHIDENYENFQYQRKGKEKKYKKKEYLKLKSATCVAHFLLHKSSMIGKGVFSQIQNIV